ncbi:MAG: DUF1836 domain-containing protein [Lachnospiraceae bacterium]|nr:DUF1836 domain-containing protein [Lachnospiraceae bacterium]
MTIDPQDILNSILSSLERIDYIKPKDIPGIDLYMDQVTTFMEEHLQSSKRYEEDKILTKTMINNYAKNHLLPSPEKKKYSKEHMLLLIFIYYYKGILSIGDIQSLLQPLTDRYFQIDGPINMETIYEEVFSLEKSQVEKMKEDVIEKYKIASEMFPEAAAEDQQFLQIFSFICLLSFDIYVKKQVIEKLIDELPKKESTKKHKD